MWIDGGNAKDRMTKPDLSATRRDQRDGGQASRTRKGKNAEAAKQGDDNMVSVQYKSQVKVCIELDTDN